MRAEMLPPNGVIELIGDLKDRMMALEEAQQRPAGPRQLAPGNHEGEPWSPCNTEEQTFYGTLTQFF